ncbi:MAG TPA: abortive infection family protein [Hyphomonadaceae bacterium]|nr:abortive infection family protein [Hyphomonadaceae bacterium]
MLGEHIPNSELERGVMLQNLLVARATGEAASDQDYEALRRHFMQDLVCRALLPNFVRTCRDLPTFWGWIKGQTKTWAERRGVIGAAFTPLIDHLEGAGAAPLDAGASEVLAKFDEAGVHAIWKKALERRHTDPEGAITAARSLLESVCKHILDDAGSSYTMKDDLPKLYGEAAKVLNISPSQHTEEIFKQILGGCTSVVVGLGALRNRISDAHGQGKKPVKPLARHAHLVVNLAGTMATFLVETAAAKQSAGEGH